MRHEAKTMEYLRSRGYPVPAVDDLSEDGTELVMERVYGRSMVDAISRSPWTVRKQGRVLADLHLQLHDVPAPEFLSASPVGGIGTRVLHLDLHPLNVMIARSGPVVIDWANARVGDPDVDVGLAWLLMSTGEIPGGSLLTKLLGWGRGLLIEGFVSSFDRSELAGKLRAIVEWKSRDANMSAAEIERIWSMVGDAEARWS
jgi:aminoglycoside phosphotransferase (APT) family kinase protein